MRSGTSVWTAFVKKLIATNVTNKAVSKKPMKPMKGLEKVKSKLEPFKDETPMETDEVKQEKIEKSSSKVKPAKKSGKIDFSKAKPKTVTKQEQVKEVKEPKKAKPVQPVKKSKIHPKIMDSESSGDDEPPQPKEHEITKRFF